MAISVEIANFSHPTYVFNLRIEYHLSVKVMMALSGREKSSMISVTDRQISIPMDTIHECDRQTDTG